MKRVLKVTLHLNDGTKDVCNVAAKDDLTARSKAEVALRNQWDGVNGKFPGIDFAEIEWVCDIHAG
jgi:hypothetical protein